MKVLEGGKKLEKLGRAINEYLWQESREHEINSLTRPIFPRKRHKTAVEKE